MKLEACLNHGTDNSKNIEPFVDFVVKVSFHPDNKQQILHIDTETQNIQLYWRNFLIRHDSIKLGQIQQLYFI